MRPAGKRNVVSHIVAAHELSQRRACWLDVLNLSTWQYKPLKRMMLDLRERIIEMVSERRVLANGECIFCCAGKAGKSITRQCTGYTVKRVCRCVNARRSGSARQTTASRSSCPNGSTNAGPWTSCRMCYPAAPGSAPSISSTNLAGNARPSRSIRRCAAHKLSGFCSVSRRCEGCAQRHRRQQRTRTDQQGTRRMGLPQQRAATLHRTGQAHLERLRRELRRQAP